MKKTIKKLSEYATLPGLNRTASALLTENNIDPNDMPKLFPDQYNELYSFRAYLSDEDSKWLNKTDEFVEKIIDFPKNELIMIVGDYDADGVMATSILYTALFNLGYTVSFLIPNRFTDGYGMSKSLIEGAFEKNDIKLIITVDNGIAAKEAVDFAQSKGCEVIITDHHLPGENVPENCLIIDPKYNNDEFSDICGAYVILKLVFALYDEINSRCEDYTDEQANMWIFEELAPLAGIATITDIMPMLSENRTLVKMTLENINSNKYNRNSALRKILFCFGGGNFLNNLEDRATEELISFYVGPAINAISRVNGDATEAIQTVIEILQDPLKYYKPYKQNYLRQEMTSQVIDEVKESMSEKENLIFCSLSEDQFQFRVKGILGIAASQLSNKKHKVALVGSKDGNNYEFSGRGIPEYNLYEGIQRIREAHPEMNIQGGGHASAMGIRLIDFSEEQVQLFEEYLNTDIAENSKEQEITIFEWEPAYKKEIIDTLKDFQPYGNGFSKLRFQYTGKFSDFDIYNKIATIGNYQFKFFISPDKADEMMQQESTTVVFTIAFSSFKKPFFQILKD